MKLGRARAPALRALQNVLARYEHVQIHPSAFLVATNASPESVSRAVGAALDGQDRLTVAELGSGEALTPFNTLVKDDALAQWLDAHGFTAAPPAPEATRAHLAADGTGRCGVLLLGVRGGSLVGHVAETRRLPFSITLDGVEGALARVELIGFGEAFAALSLMQGRADSPEPVILRQAGASASLHVGSVPADVRVAAPTPAGS